MYEHNLDTNANTCMQNYILCIIIHVLIFIDMNKMHCRPTINQLKEKCREYNIPLCVAFVDYEKAFDSVQPQAILT